MSSRGTICDEKKCKNMAKQGEMGGDVARKLCFCPALTNTKKEQLEKTGKRKFYRLQLEC
jgi:hypothetical protein